MKIIRSDYDKNIRKAMIDADVDRNELSDYIGYNGGANLMTAIKSGALGDKYQVPLCEKLNLDIGELLQLKLKAKYENSK